jgi:Protein of unknown function (DUF3153)
MGEILIRLGMIEDANMKIIIGRNLSLAKSLGQSIESISRFVGVIRARLLKIVNQQLAIGCCLIALCLSGCVKYETGINFHGLNYGEIVEHVQIGEQLNSFSQNAVQTWLASIEQRTNQAQGRLERITDREFNVIIPFNNDRELVTKINRYFNPDLDPTHPSAKFNSHLQIDRNNFVLAVRNHLTYDIDLRSMVIQSSDPKISIASGNFVDLGFSLQSPLGVKSLNGIDLLKGIENGQNRRTWQLKPGQINHIDAVFWLINPLSIGAILIVLISGSGYYLKYRHLPWHQN